MGNSVTSDILNHHLTAFGNNDLDEIMNDYSEESELLTSEGHLKGLKSIRDFFADYFLTVPAGSFFEMKKVLVSGNVAFILWESESSVAKIPFGTDTFFIEEGKIRIHTVAAHTLANSISK